MFRGLWFLARFGNVIIKVGVETEFIAMLRAQGTYKLVPRNAESNQLGGGRDNSVARDKTHHWKIVGKECTSFCFACFESLLRKGSRRANAAGGGNS